MADQTPTSTSVEHPKNKLGVAGEWIVLLVVWCFASAIALAMVCVMLGPAE
jgi:hypothetical protein